MADTAEKVGAGSRCASQVALSMMRQRVASVSSVVVLNGSWRISSLILTSRKPTMICSLLLISIELAVSGQHVGGAEEVVERLPLQLLPEPEVEPGDAEVG